MTDEMEYPERPSVPPRVVLECDCGWTYLSDGSIPDSGLVEIMEDHQARHD